MIRDHFVTMPRLITPRLELRGLRGDDVPLLLEISVYDGVFASDLSEAERILEKINHDCAQGEALHWGICLKTTGEIVGSCGFYRGFSDNTGEIGYLLKMAHRGYGYMTEAVSCITDFGLHQMGLKQIVAYTEAQNEASVAVLRRAGFQQVTDSSRLKFAKPLIASTISPS
jgi:ribosomal-protein-alanine N-acetyltransferase